ncbi:MAG: DUF1028 domain-containing protein [Salegentibacter sp.]
MKKTILPVLLLALSFGKMPAQTANIDADAFAHTFSIVARDPATGEMAVGVQSHWFSVGTSVPWGKSGVGVVATQSFVNPAFGPKGLALMESGKTADEALEALIREDDGRDYRQVALLDDKGHAAAYTGEKCVESAAQIVGENFSVQANLKLNDKVVPAMAEAFRNNSDLPLAERVMEVLKAAQEAGGDLRGRQSAALIVVGPEKTDKEWEDKKIDLRVDDSDTPVQELDRLLRTARAYEHMNKGDLAVENNDMEKAMQEYGAAGEIFPGNLEMKYWKAVAMANNGRVKEALPIFREIFAQNDHWRIMTMRLPASGLLNVSDEELDRIIN